MPCGTLRTARDRTKCLRTASLRPAKGPFPKPPSGEPSRLLVESPIDDDPVRTHTRSRLRAIALLVVAGTLAIAATAASGVQPAQFDPIPDAAFRPVSVPALPGDSGAALRVRGVAPVDSYGSSSLLAASDELREPPLAALSSELPPRAQPSVAAPKPVVIKIPPPAPKTTHALRGYASYYCYAGSSPCTNGYADRGGFDAYAAAGPQLRAALGANWRGSIVYVDGVRVKLIDWCQCYKGEPQEKLLDLYHDVFSLTGSPVTIRW